MLFGKDSHMHGSDMNLCMLDGAWHVRAWSWQHLVLCVHLTTKHLCLQELGENFSESYLWTMQVAISTFKWEVETYRQWGLQGGPMNKQIPVKLPCTNPNCWSFPNEAFLLVFFFGNGCFQPVFPIFASSFKGSKVTWRFKEPLWIQIE